MEKRGPTDRSHQQYWQQPLPLDQAMSRVYISEPPRGPPYPPSGYEQPMAYGPPPPHPYHAPPPDPRYYAPPMEYAPAHGPPHFGAGHTVPPHHGMMPRGHPFHPPSQELMESYQHWYGMPSHFMHAPPQMEQRPKLTEDQIPQRLMDFSMNPMTHEDLIEIVQTTQNPSLHFLIYAELMAHNFLMLMKHQLGHSVVLALMDHISPAELHGLISNILDGVVDLAENKCGCRIVQRAVAKASPRDLIRLTEKLAFSALSLIKSPHGNHVLQRCVEKLPADQLPLIITPLLVDFFSVAAHMYGCRVVQRIVDRYCRDAGSIDEVARIMDMIIKNCSPLVKDKFGNYVIQHLLEQGTDEVREKVVESLGPHIVSLAQQKFASNVMERCLTHANAKQRRRLVEVIIEERLILRDGREGSAIVAMADDPFANYVVQKMIDVADKDQRLMIEDILIAHIDDLNKSASGRHVVAKLHKEQVFRDRQMSPPMTAQPGSPLSGSTSWRMPASSAPTDPFATHHSEAGKY